MCLFYTEILASTKLPIPHLILQTIRKHTERRKRMNEKKIIHKMWSFISQEVIELVLTYRFYLLFLVRFSNDTRHSILEYKSKIQQVVLFSIENLHCHKVHSPSKRILCVVRLFLLVFQCIVQMVNVNHGWIKFITIKPLLLRQFGVVAIVVVVSCWRSSNTSLSFDWN